MKRLAGYLSILTAFLAMASSRAELPLSDLLPTNRITEIEGYLFNDQFEQALSLCSLMISDEPASPVGYSYLTGTMMAQMTDLEEDIYGSEFERLIDTTVRLAEQALTSQSPRQAAWSCFWIGNAHAYQALYNSRFGSLYNAIKSGMKAREAFARGLEFDSTNYDLLVGLGSYHYWKSAKVGILSWVGLFKNEKERGIEELRQAYESASLYSESARRAMVWIWLNEKEYDSVIVAAGELRSLYPTGKAVLWPMAQALMESKQPEKGIEAYLALREQLAADPGNYFNLIECDYLLCRAYQELSRDDNAADVAAAVDAYDQLIPREIRKQQKKKLDFLERRMR